MKKKILSHYTLRKLSKREFTAEYDWFDLPQTLKNFQKVYSVLAFKNNKLLLFNQNELSDTIVPQLLVGDKKNLLLVLHILVKMALKRP